MTAAPGRVLRLGRFGLTVADLARAEAFYRDGLGFVRSGGPARADAALLRLLGAPGNAHTLTMRLGWQEIELAAFDPPGRPYPTGIGAANIAFQHFAIVTRDIDRAYARVSRQAGFVAISAGGPQRLPPSSGSVRAAKFRDPDGHPLELLEFPPGEGPRLWRDSAADAATLGIDHSAIDVADTARSAAFYTRLLGFLPGARSRNAGPDQQRLDGLDRDIVDVIGLQPAAEATPHVELLAYRVPAARGSAIAAMHDIAATRLAMEVDGIVALAGHLSDSGVALASPGLVTLTGGAVAALVRDPDGHALILVENLQS